MKKNKITLKEFLESVYDNPERLGIPGNGFEYQNLNSNQNATKEFFRTQTFLKKIFCERIVNEAP